MYINLKNDSVLKGMVGRKFNMVLIWESSDVRKREWNLERFVMFVRFIFQSTPETRKTKNINYKMTTVQTLAVRVIC